LPIVYTMMSLNPNMLLLLPHIPFLSHLIFFSFFFFFNDTATTEIYTLSLHDALPIWTDPTRRAATAIAGLASRLGDGHDFQQMRSEEHTSELQSRGHLVCRLLLEKKKKQKSIQRDTEQ